MTQLSPLLMDGPWIPIKDGDGRARALHDRHYSRRHFADGRKPKQFVGPGSHLVLFTVDCKALFVWRLFNEIGLPTRAVSTAPSSVTSPFAYPVGLSWRRRSGPEKSGQHPRSSEATTSKASLGGGGLGLNRDLTPTRTG